ncbi:MAG: hypothetical protein NZ580_01370 [Bacteroidia bacterium]|nr:hypothetical protein [Bacteroidia bacterium]
MRRRYAVFIFLGVWWGCAPSSGGQTAATDTLPTLRAKGDACTMARQLLPPLTPPIQMPRNTSSDPFPPEVQTWLRQQVGDSGIFVPVGVWEKPEQPALWLVEAIRSNGTSYYALLTQDCRVLDTMVWAYQIIQPDCVAYARGMLDASGLCVLQHETHITEFSGEQPTTCTMRRESRSQVDWAAGRFVR